jgi:predicted phosphodiesterase
MLLGELPFSSKADKIYKLEKIKSNLNENQLEFIQSWDYKIEFLHENSKLLFIHGSPKDLINGYVYPDTNLNSFIDVPFDIIIMGHTHYPFIKKYNEKIFVNVGSVGLPRDNGLYSSFCILDLDRKDYKIYRVKINQCTLDWIADSNEIHKKVKEVFSREAKSFIGELL